MSEVWYRLVEVPKRKVKGVSVRTVSDWPSKGLRTVKIGGCRLTCDRWIDDFLRRFEVRNDDKEKDKIDQVVEDVMKGFR